MPSITVRVVDHQGTSALVEYSEEGLLKRRVIPLSAIKNDTVAEAVLRNGAPYGVDLSGLDLLKGIADFPTRFEQACRSRGLWTRQDFERNPTLVHSALQTALRFDVTTTLNYVAEQD